MEEFIHGGKIHAATREYGGKEEDWLDFSANINPLGLAPEIVQVLKRNLKTIHHYPDEGEELKELLAADLGINSRQILLTNGAAEAFFIIAQALALESALLLEPTFCEYRRALQAKKIPIKELILSPQDKFIPRQSSLDRAWQEKMLLVICNPNNPTGVLLGKEELLAQQERAQENRGWLMLDESFQDFLEEPPSLCQNLNERTIIVRSLTKFFALPGLRLGYILASEDIIATLEKQRPAWNVNSLALLAGIKALTLKDYITTSRLFIQEARKELLEGLTKLAGFEVYPSPVNYLLFSSAKSQGLLDFLKERRILLRDCSNFRGLDKTWFRCAVRSPRENNYLLASLREFLER